MTDQIADAVYGPDGSLQHIGFIEAGVISDAAFLFATNGEGRQGLVNRGSPCRPVRIGPVRGNARKRGEPFEHPKHLISTINERFQFRSDGDAWLAMQAAHWREPVRGAAVEAE